MTTWANLSPEVQLRIITSYNDFGQDTPEFKSEAHQLNIEPDSLGRYVRQFNKAKEISENIAVQEADVQALETYVSLPSYHTRPRLTDITTYNKQDDTEQWLDWLATRASTDPVISVMHLCDIHEPFSHDGAVSVALSIVKKVQPDLIVIGSDFADFYLLSYFGTDPEVHVDDYDELDALSLAWGAFIDAIKAVAPNARLVFIYGNHERRIIRYLLNNAVNVSKTVLRAFKSIIRRDDQVWYVGDVDHIRMGPLQVEHGNRYGIHAPKSRLIDEGGQCSVMFGHGHKRKFYMLRGADFSVSAVMSGCLCELTPHYLGRGQSSVSGEKWVHGTAVATLDLTDRLVQFENPEFITNAKSSWTFFRGERINSDTSES